MNSQKWIYKSRLERGWENGWFYLKKKNRFINAQKKSPIIQSTNAQAINQLWTISKKKSSRNKIKLGENMLKQIRQPLVHRLEDRARQKQTPIDWRTKKNRQNGLSELMILVALVPVPFHAALCICVFNDIPSQKKHPRRGSTRASATKVDVHTIALCNWWDSNHKNMVLTQ